MKTLRVCFMVPTFHRTDSVIRLVETLTKATNNTDIKLELGFCLYIQDASPADESRFLELERNNAEPVVCYFVPQFSVPVIGHIRNRMMHDCLPDIVNAEFDLVYMLDDDIWFSEDVSKMVTMLYEFKNSDAMLGYVREFKGRNMKLTQTYDPDSVNPTGPSTGFGIVMSVGKKPQRLFDNVAGKLSVGEDIYYLIKCLALGENCLNITGIVDCYQFQEDWLENTAQGGGIHEMATTHYGDCPTDMVARNELLSRSNDSYVQKVCGYAFHYDSYLTSFRRLRPELIHWLLCNTIATNDDLVLREPKTALMPFDGSHRTVFGLGKVDYQTVLPDRNAEFQKYYSSIQVKETTNA